MVLRKKSFQIIENVTLTDFVDEPRSNAIWLNVVWSKAVLGRHTDQDLSSVLEPEFYNKLICKR